MAWTLATDIAERIYQLREVVLGWTQQEFGTEAGVAWGQVSAWENGHARPPRGRLERLTAKFGWPLEIFREGGPLPSEVILAKVPQPAAKVTATATRGRQISAGEPLLDGTAPGALGLAIARVLHEIRAQDDIEKRARRKDSTVLALKQLATTARDLGADVSDIWAAIDRLGQTWPGVRERA
jgi:transcriptional regulator with XRE-family HTH domain